MADPRKRKRDDTEKKPEQTSIALLGVGALLFTAAGAGAMWLYQKVAGGNTAAAAAEKAPESLSFKPQGGVLGAGSAASTAEYDAVEMDESMECCVCMEAPKSMAANPCGHRCVCATCASRLLETSGLCPICRASISSFLKIYG
eukprot:a855556_50.p2 GENE.a855556_50~~a855556_50.p2  ORF type:complete len:164 (+),score=42.83 a855556_50:61-492(+)